MSSEQKIDGPKLIKFLTEKWHSRPCPMCGTAQWQLQEKLFQLMEFSAGNIVIGGPVIPVAPVICGNCGNTILVNAITAGMVEVPQPAPKPGAAS